MPALLLIRNLILTYITCIPATNKFFIKCNSFNSLLRLNYMAVMSYTFEIPLIIIRKKVCRCISPIIITPITYIICNFPFLLHHNAGRANWTETITGNYTRDNYKLVLQYSSLIVTRYQLLTLKYRKCTITATPNNYAGKWYDWQVATNGKWLYADIPRYFTHGSEVFVKRANIINWLWLLAVA